MKPAIIKDGPKFIRLDANKLRREAELDALYAKCAPWIYRIALVLFAGAVLAVVMSGGK